MNRTTVKVGVIVTPFENQETVNALKHLVIYQNTLQTSFEFQFLPVPDDLLFSTLSSKEAIDREAVEQAMPDFLIRYRKSLTEMAHDYGLWSDSDLPIVILSTIKFSDNYYLSGDDDWGIVALGNWQRYMSPPSIVEFFLVLLLELAIDFACGDSSPLRHNATKGCTFDFTANISDARFAVLSGFLCSACVKSITKAHSEQLAKDAKLLLSKKWLGTASEPSNVAITAKKLGFDLFHTKGVSPTRWERLLSILEEEVVKTILTIIALVVGTAILVYLGLKST